VGIGVGVVLGAAAIASLVCFMGRRQARQDDGASDGVLTPQGQSLAGRSELGGPEMYSPEAHELPGIKRPPELEGDRPLKP